MDLDSLNARASGAIWQAEQLDARSPDAATAWAEVSRLEEELARHQAVTLPEGRIARRGAVRAALKAGNRRRAISLVQAYVSEAEAPASLKTALMALLNQESLDGGVAEPPLAGTHSAATE
jgi:hypothetical protein